MLLWNWCPTCWSFSEGGPSTHPRGRISMRRVFLWMLLCGWLAAPPNRAQQPQKPEETPTVTIGVTVENVVAPVLVFDKQWSYVNSIRPAQFPLYDNPKEQNISVDVVYQPISLVIAIQ